jgi:hypothetical protein
MVGIRLSEPQIKEGGLSFYGKGVNTFKDMGLLTFFNKNMKELKGPLLLTIFNKKWQDAAVLFHTDKRTKSEESSKTKDRYSVSSSKTSGKNPSAIGPSTTRLSILLSKTSTDSQLLPNGS